MKSRKTKNPKNKDLSLAFVDHLTELRSRAFAYLFVLVTGSIVGYLLNAQITSILTRPLNQPLFYSTVTGGFDFVFQVSFFFGFLLSIPMLLFQLFQFVRPALPVTSIRKIILYVLASAVLLIMGICFAYFVGLPMTLYFLQSFATDQIKSLLSTSEYFRFISGYLVGFGVAFQLPLIMLFIDSISPLQMKTLLGLERVVVVACFIVAAILTPTPDAINQCIFAVPLILLYQLSLVLIYLQHKR